MASYNPGESVGQSAESQHPSKGAASHSVSTPKPQSAYIGHSRTELPTEPEQIHHAFERPVPDPLAIGNPAYELSLKLEGKLGHFMDRSATAAQPTYIPMQTLAFRAGAFLTLKDVLRRLLKMKGYIEQGELDSRAADIANTLADGIQIMAYLKLRSVNSLHVDTSARFLKKPQCPTIFEIPSPFALAISQLGIFKVSSLTKELTLVPTYPADATRFGLPAHRSWSTTKYVQAVEYAKSLGMRFTGVDLKVKLGSSWWLFDQENEEDTFFLTCPLPEDNYTEATAVLMTLFCANEAGSSFNIIFDIDPLGAENYGSMLRNPPQDINVSTYFAIDEAPVNVWDTV